MPSWSIRPRWARPGVDEVKWLKPIRPDDDLHLRATVLDPRASNSRPDMGFVRFEFELFNAAGERGDDAHHLADDGAAGPGGAA